MNNSDETFTVKKMNIDTPKIATSSIKPKWLYGLIILAVITVPMVLAYFIFTTGWGMPTNTSNKGTLLQPPTPIQELSLREADALKNLYPATPKKWRMLIPVRQNCDDRCEQNLYVSRQVHIRLAEKAYRVERILLLLDQLSEQKLKTLKEEHPETLMFSSDMASLQQWLAGSNVNKAADQLFYLIDQQGFAMMFYGQEQTGQDLLDDIKKLLKFTYDK